MAFALALIRAAMAMTEDARDSGCPEGDEAKVMGALMSRRG